MSEPPGLLAIMYKIFGVKSPPFNLRRKHCTYVTQEELGVVVFNFYVSGNITRMTSLFKKVKRMPAVLEFQCLQPYILTQATRRCLMSV